MSSYRPYVSYDINRYVNGGGGLKATKITVSEVDDDDGYLHSEKKEWIYRPGVRFELLFSLNAKYTEMLAWKDLYEDLWLPLGSPVAGIINLSSSGNQTALCKYLAIKTEVI